MPLFRMLGRAWWALLVLALLVDPALAQTGKEAATGGLSDFIDFTKILPDLHDVFATLLTVISASDLRGFVEWAARIVSVAIFMLSSVVLWLNYSTGKRFGFLGIDGTVNSVILAFFIMIFVGVGVPRVVGQTAWNTWMFMYGVVSTKTNPIIQKAVEKQTEELASAVFDFTVSNAGVGLAPIIAATNVMSGQASLDDKNTLLGPGFNDNVRKASLDKANRFSSIWAFGSLLIAGMFLGYYGILFGSGTATLFLAIFMPLAFAFFAVSQVGASKFLGGVVSNFLIAAMAPALFLVNIIITFQGPVEYMKKMMVTSTKAAQDNAEQWASAMQGCVRSLSPTVDDIFGFKAQLTQTTCQVGSTVGMTVRDVGQMTLYILVGWIVVAVLFSALSSLGFMVFREFKSAVDLALNAAAASVNRPSSGSGRLGYNLANRAAGAAVLTAGLATGNRVLATVGERALGTGRGAASGMASAAIRSNFGDRGESRGQQAQGSTGPNAGEKRLSDTRPASNTLGKTQQL